MNVDVDVLEKFELAVLAEVLGPAAVQLEHALGAGVLELAPDVARDARGVAVARVEDEEVADAALALLFYADDGHGVALYIMSISIEGKYIYIFISLLETGCGFTKENREGKSLTSMLEIKRCPGRRADLVSGVDVRRRREVLLHGVVEPSLRGPGLVLRAVPKPLDLAPDRKRRHVNQKLTHRLPTARMWDFVNSIVDVEDLRYA